MKHLLCLSLSFVLASAGHGQALPRAPLQSADLQADAEILRSAYEQLHPGLYRYSSKLEMDADFALLHDALGHDQDLRDAFLAFSEFAAKVRCGHTQANPLNQPKAIIDTLFKTPTRLPFYFDWLDGKMIVTRDFTPGHVLPRGTEVTQVNGVAIPAILSRLLSITRADGANNNKRIAQLAVHGSNIYETFDLYHPMFFPHDGVGDTLLIREPKSRKVKRIVVDSLTFEQRIAPIKMREQQRTGGDSALFEWQDLQDGSGYLRMSTWALFNSQWNWKQWLNDHLNEAAARNAPALILDLRGNEGGDDVGSEMIPHLIDAPITLSSMRRLVRYRKIPDDLAPYLDTWDRGFRDWGNAAVDLPEPWPTAPAGVTYLQLKRSDDDANGDVIQPAGKRFRGKVLVLIDAANSSATFQFAQNIQSHHLGTLIGQPTGGSQRGINGGAFFFLRLPHSGIEMDLPLIGTFPTLPAPDAGVTPDILVQPTAADLVTGYDAPLAAARLAISR